MALREDLLEDVDDIRGIPGEFGLHRFKVWVRVSTWSGRRAGDGDETVVLEKRLYVGDRENPHVKEVTDKNIVAGSSELQAQEWVIGPFTTEYPGRGGSNTPEQLSPEKKTSPTTIYYVLKGPGLPSEGILCQQTGVDTDKPFRYMVHVKSTGRKRPAT